MLYQATFANALLIAPAEREVSPLLNFYAHTDGNTDLPVAIIRPNLRKSVVVWMTERFGNHLGFGKDKEDSSGSLATEDSRFSREDGDLYIDLYRYIKEGDDGWTIAGGVAARAHSKGRGRDGILAAHIARSHRKARQPGVARLDRGGTLPPPSFALFKKSVYKPRLRVV